MFVCLFVRGLFNDVVSRSNYTASRHTTRLPLLIKEGKSLNVHRDRNNETLLRRHDDDDQWRYSPDRALASLTSFMIVIVRCGVISSTIDLF
jgi:hypothetical protein